MPARSHGLKEAAIVTNRGTVLEARQVETRAAPEARLATSAAVSAEYRTNPVPVRTRDDVAQAATAFLLTDLNWKPVYSNDAADLVLTYPDQARVGMNPSAVQERIRSIFRTARFSPDTPPAIFLSGRRHYVCRPSLLQSQNRPPIVALLLERCPQVAVELSEVSRRFHLSRRESETVKYLSHGLTTKEVARHMSVSPNTVKQFVRLIMSKMGVTTRSGIIGKLLSG